MIPRKGLVFIQTTEFNLTLLLLKYQPFLAARADTVLLTDEAIFWSDPENRECSESLKYLALKSILQKMIVFFENSIYVYNVFVYIHPAPFLRNQASVNFKSDEEVV